MLATHADAVSLAIDQMIVAVMEDLEVLPAGLKKDNPNNRTLCGLCDGTGILVSLEEEAEEPTTVACWGIAHLTHIHADRIVEREVLQAS